MRPAPQFVTNRECASGSDVEATLRAPCDICGSFQKSLKNLSVAVDRSGTSGRSLKPRQIGHPIALKVVSGEQLLKTDLPGGPGKERKALR
jgi:hypothetical protein